ncbi:uncharacterized protein [Miscanthus floridulus]|uniref:uncharacterized protein n=1 Tax=Miscanthus floridulus TaxID=154761 RepID=UPI0034593B4D
MSGVLMDVFAELVTWTLSFSPVKIESFEPATVMQSVVTRAHHDFVCYVCSCINGLRLARWEIALFKRSQFRSFVACANAFAKLCTIFRNLVMVDKRYSSLGIILIILLIFIVSLFVIVSRKGHMERDDNDANKADDGIIATTTKADGRERGEAGQGEEEIKTKGHTEKKVVRGEEEESKGDGFGDISVEGPSRTEDHTGKKKLRGEEKERGEVGHEEEEVASPSHDNFVLSNVNEIEIKGYHTGKKEVRGGGGEEEKRRDLLLMVLLHSMLLCFMRYFRNMEMTNCLLFLSCSLGELTLMMERLSSEFDVAPAFEVIHRAFLVMGLMTAHTMAAELLGEYVLLVCMPELVAALAWLTIYLGSCDDGAAACAVRTVKAVVRKAELPLLCLVGILASIIVTDTDEAEEATDLLWGNMSSAIVAVLSSVILPSLCMLVLRQWQGQTTAAPSSSELEGAVLSLCRDVPCKALIIFFLAKQMLLADTLVVPLMFSVFSLILLLAASMYARAHGLHGLRVRAAGRGEKRD